MSFQKQGRKEIQKILSLTKLFNKFERLCQDYLDEKIDISKLFYQIKSSFGRKNYDKILKHIHNYLPKHCKDDITFAFQKGANVQMSKQLTYLLRHGGRKEGLNIDDEGYVEVDELLVHKQIKRKKLTFDRLKMIVDTNDKKRFTLTKDEVSGKWKVRANQGHSMKIKKLDLKPIKKCDVCVHGTYYKAWDLIKKSGGLNKMGRQHIHMAMGLPGEKGVISGMRTNCQILIYIDVEKATNDGFKFFLSSNNVVLCSGDKNGYLPLKYIKKVVDLVAKKDIDMEQ